MALVAGPLWTNTDPQGSVSAVTTAPRPSTSRRPPSIDSIDSAQPRNKKGEAAVSAPDSIASTLSAASFELETDLFGFASRAVSSRDPNTLRNASSALGVCIDADIQQQRVGHLLNATPSDRHERELARAATLFLSRCRGFVNNDFSAIAAMHREIASRLRDLGGFAPGVSGSELTAADFRAIVDQRDWLSFEYALHLAMKTRIEKSGPTVDNALFGVAYTAAACDLGKECGPDSITYAAHCVRSRQCLGSWERTFEQGLDGEQRATVAGYRAAIVRAVKEKNYAYFGLAP
jgi:hypothetical protein